LEILKNKIVKWFFVLAFVVGGISIYISTNRPVSDFGNYYFGSKFLHEGKFNAEVYDCWSFNKMIVAEGEKGLYENYTPVPPFSAVFYLPFSSCSLFTAKLIFNIFSLLIFILVFIHAIRHFKINNSWICLVPIIFLFPFFNNITFGQTYLLLIALLLEGYIAFEKKQFWLAGICWALTIHLKIFPIIILLFLLLTKEWKAFLWTILLTGVFFGLSLFFIPSSIWTHYLVDILPRLMRNEINNPFATDYQTMYVFLEQIFVRDKMLNPNSPMDSQRLFEIVNGIYSFFILLPAILISFRSDISSFKKFSIWLFAGMMVSGYGTNYGLLLLVFPLLAFLFTEHEFNRNGFIVLILTTAICFIPVHQFGDLAIPLRFPRLWMLLLLYLVFISSMKIKMNWKVAVPVFVFMMSMILLIPKNRNDGSEYFLDKEEALLIVDYEVEGDSMKLFCMEEQGIKTKCVFVHGKLQPFYFGNSSGQFSSGCEKANYVLNDSLVVYLSDKNRGVGFYTLRKTPFKKYSQMLNDK
jgi:hypothetical protein